MSDEEDTTPDVKLSPKKSWITVQSLISAVIMSIALTGTWIRVDNRTAANAEAIVELNARFTDYVEKTTISLDTINATLTEMLVEARIKNEIAGLEMSDRWTSEMMESFSADWLEVLQEYHPEMKHSNVPNVKDTQREHLHLIQ
jgi:hypothetical protein